MRKNICNGCGKELSELDDFTLKYNHKFGYSSKFDGDEIHIDLCAKCADKLTEHLIETCKHTPIVVNNF